MIRNRFTISDVAERVGLNPWTLRRLESLGRIPMPSRDPVSGVRIYSEHDVETLRTALAAVGSERIPPTAN